LAKFPVVAVDRLVRDLEKNNHLLKYPSAKEIGHYYHIAWPIVICCILGRRLDREEHGKDLVP
jgi:hypothetical protein